MSWIVSRRHYRRLIKWQWKLVGQIEGLVEEVVVVNPHQFKVISESVKKTDRRDAQMLALFLQKGMLPLSTYEER
jgi:hypothetical protein